MQFYANMKKLYELILPEKGYSFGGGEDNIAATGTDRDTAYELTKSANRVTSASDGNQCIKIPADWPVGVPISVYCNLPLSYNGLKIFSGQAGDKINFFGDFDSGFSIPDAWMKTFLRINDNNWFVITELSS